jgi:hypothetical protein
VLDEAKPTRFVRANRFRAVDDFRESLDCFWDGATENPFYKLILAGAISLPIAIPFGQASLEISVDPRAIG